MWTEEHVYALYRKVQGLIKEKPYRLPKDFDKHLEKMTEVNNKSLRLLTQFFNTKWSTINPEVYFECGFELYNNFTYVNFLDPRVIRLYIQRDKAKKRSTEINKKSILESFRFILTYVKENNLPTFHVYFVSRVGETLVPIKHYLDNKIDHYFLVWLIKEHFISIDDNNRTFIPYVVDRYRDTIVELDGMQEFLNKIKDRIKSYARN